MSSSASDIDDDSSLQDDFFRAMRHVAEPVYILTTNDSEGRPIGFTATSVTSLSVNPPSMLFCVNRNNEGADEYVEGKMVAANVLCPGQEELCKRFAGMIEGVEGTDKFKDGVAWHTEDGVPVLDDTCVTMIGEITELYDGFTHNIAVLKLTDVQVHKTKPLIYWNRQYVEL